MWPNFFAPRLLWTWRAANCCDPHALPAWSLAERNLPMLHQHHSIVHGLPLGTWTPHTYNPITRAIVGCRSWLEQRNTIIVVGAAPTRARCADRMWLSDLKQYANAGTWVMSNYTIDMCTTRPPRMRATHFLNQTRKGHHAHGAKTSCLHRIN